MILKTKARAALALFAVLAAAYSATASSVVTTDVFASQFAAWNLVTNQTNSIDDFDFLEDVPIRNVWVATNGDHEVIARSPGTIAISLPGYAVAKLLFGVVDYSFWPGAITAIILTASAMVLMFLALSSFAGIRVSFLASVVLGLGTPVWSVAAEGVWPHTLTVFAIAGMAFASSRRRWWLAGVFAGIGIWGRVHVAFIAAAFGILEAWRSRDPFVAVRIAVPSVALLGLMAVWTRWMYGSWRLTGNYSVDALATMNESYGNVWINLLGLFLSPEKGIFIWTPIALLLIPAVIRSWRKAPGWTRSLAIGGMIYMIVQGVLIRFQGGDNFWSYRLGLELVVSATPIAVYALPNLGRIGKFLMAPLAVIQICVMWFGSWLALPGLPAEQAWFNNSLVATTMQDPLFGILFFGSFGALGFVIPKMLRSLGLIGTDSRT